MQVAACESLAAGEDCRDLVERFDVLAVDPRELCLKLLAIGWQLTTAPSNTWRDMIIVDTSTGDRVDEHVPSK